MNENENGSNGMHLWQIAGGAALVVGLIALARNIPYIVRYIKMRAL
jgi:hypothetical protein